MNDRGGKLCTNDGMVSVHVGSHEIDTNPTDKFSPTRGVVECVFLI